MSELTVKAIFDAPYDKSEDYVFGDPYDHGGFHVETGGYRASGLRRLYVDGREVARLQQGMLHETIILFEDGPEARSILTANGIEVDGELVLERKMSEYVPDSVLYESVPPVAIWMTRMPGWFQTSSKLRTGWERIATTESDWSHAIGRAYLDIAEWDDEYDPGEGEPDLRYRAPA